MAKQRPGLWRWVLPLAAAGALVAGVVWGPALVGKATYYWLARHASQNPPKSLRSEKDGSLAKLVELVGPAVVEIQVRRSYLPDEGTSNLLRRLGRDSSPQEVRALGSGVIIDSKNGYVLTNAHVVEDANQVVVVTADHRRLRGQWIRRSLRTDLAIVKVKSDKLASAALGSSETARVGDVVLAIGSPEGFTHTVTSGIISARGRVDTTLKRLQDQDFLQTDAAINRGNSGGPLVNTRGEVIGINTFIVSQSGGSEGMGFAIPAKTVKEVLDELTRE